MLLLSDTVGFIENLPHGLIKAFRSTLEEVKYADVLLVVIDSADPHHRMHREVTEDTLRDLDALTIPRICVYNKADIRDKDLDITNTPDSESVYISARTGYGTDELLDRMYDIFRKKNRTVDAVIPYKDGRLLNRIHNSASIISEEHAENGTHIVAVCPPALADHIEELSRDFS